MASLDVSAFGSLDLLSMFGPDWKAVGTGLKPLSEEANEKLGKDVVQQLTDVIRTQLPALFGDYPSPGKDTAPSAVFIAVFAILYFGHAAIFGLGFSRGHKFYASAALAMHALWKVIGFAIRLKWAHDVLNVPVAIASVVFTQVPPLILCVVNMYLATRVFTWRHPEAGRSLWFRTNNLIIYCLVVGVIIMAILGTALPNLYYMTEKHYRMCQRVAEAASVLQILYALAGLIVLVLAYSFKPGSIDHKFVFGNKNKTEEDYPKVIQPTWIEKFSPTYFPTKTARHVVHKNDKVIRVMPSAEAPAGGLSRSVNEETSSSAPKIITANAIIFAATIGLLLLSCFRCVSMFIHKPRGGGDDKPMANVVFNSTIFYVFYGAVEALVSIFYLVMRIDLRFYIPELTSKKQMITSSMSANEYSKSAVSENQSEVEAASTHESSQQPQA